MKTFTLGEIQEAQDWRPQIERFVMTDAIYVVEASSDYAVLPTSVDELIALKEQVG